MPALDMVDPFATTTLVPPRPSLRPADEAQLEPCRKEPPLSPLTLVDVVDLALCNNPQTREAWANSRVQAAQVGVAQSAFLPNLNATLSASRNWTSAVASASPTVQAIRPLSSPYGQHSAGATLSYLLYDFGARSANFESARQLLAVARATQDSTVQTVFLAGVQAFYQTQATQTALEAAQQSERASLESFNAADARYRVGVATPADKLQAQTAYSQAVLNRIRAEGNFRNAQGVLANAIGLDANRPLRFATASMAVPVEGFEKDVGALIEEARQRRPDLVASEAQFLAARASAEAVRAAGKPTISLSMSSNYSDISDIPSTRTSAIGLGVNVPLFTGFGTTYRIRAAEAQAEVRGAQRDRINLQVALDVWQAYQNLLTATQSVRSSTDLLSSAEQSERVALGRYKAGAGGILDALNAQSALASARQQRIQASLDWNVSRATLAQAMGALDYGLLEMLAGAGEKGSTRKEPQQ